MTGGARDSVLVTCGDVTIESYVDGAGPVVVILPSYGRDGGGDFDHLTARLVAAGTRVLRPQPRGIAGSTGPMGDLTLHDLAADVAAVVRAQASEPVLVLGHAFGNLVARMLATDHPDAVSGVILAAAQSANPPPQIAKAPFLAGDLSAPDDDRLAVLREAFFAPDGDARVWLGGWYPETLQMQRKALASVPPASYWSCGTVPLLEIIPSHDAFKPKSSWSELADQFGSRVTTRIVEGAGHALFPERPDAVAAVIVPWVCRFRPSPASAVAATP